MKPTNADVIVDRMMSEFNARYKFGEDTEQFRFRNNKQLHMMRQSKSDPPTTAPISEASKSCQRLLHQVQSHVVYVSDKDYVYLNIRRMHNLLDHFNDLIVVLYEIAHGTFTDPTSRDTSLLKLACQVGMVTEEDGKLTIPDIVKASLTERFRTLKAPTDIKS